MQKKTKSKSVILFLLAPFACLAAQDAAVPVSDEDSSAEVLKLEDCIQRSLDNNPGILQAKSTLERSQGTIIVARSQALPHVSINGTYTELDKGKIDTFVGRSFLSPTDWQTAINIEQLVYAGGRVKAGIAMAKLREDKTLLDFQKTVNDVLVAVRERFYDVLLTKQQIEVQKQSLELLKEAVKTAQSKFDAGTLPRYNVLRAEVELANAKPALIKAQNNYRLALDDLARLMGIQNRSKERKLPFLVEGKLEQIPFKIELKEALELAYQQRPETKSRAMQKEIQEKNIVVQRAGLLPTFSAFGSYGYQKERFASPLDRTNQGWTIGFKGSFPIFDGLETYGKVSEAREDLKLAGLQMDESSLNVEFEVRKAYSELLEAVLLIEASVKADEKAKEGLRQISSRFEVGAATQLEVLDARVAMTEAQLNSIEALHDYNVALAHLKRATGSDNTYRYQSEE